MRELIYTVLELEEWCSTEMPCSFCTTLFSEKSKIVCQIRTRSKETNRLVENDFACQECKEKFEHDELLKCEKCGRLKTKSNIDFRSGKYTCDCEEEEKELPPLPNQRESMVGFYERQINELREKEKQLTEEVDTHLEALEISEVWNKRQKQELLDEISKLKERVKQLEEQNNQLTAQVEVKETKKWPWKTKK
jgi:hypothetical protein